MRNCAFFRIFSTDYHDTFYDTFFLGKKTYNNLIKNVSSFFIGLTLSYKLSFVLFYISRKFLTLSVNSYPCQSPTLTLRDLKFDFFESYLFFYFYFYFFFYGKTHTFIK